MALERQGATTRLVMHFDDRFDYSFEHDRQSGRLVLSLPGVRLGDTPVLGELSDTPIRSFDAMDGDGGVELHMGLREPVLTRLNGQRDGQPPRLVLDLIPDRPDAGKLAGEPVQSERVPAKQAPPDSERPTATADAQPLTPPVQPAPEAAGSAVAAVTPPPRIVVTPRDASEGRSALAVMAAARALAARGELRIATQRLEELLVREPEAPRARELLAALLIRTGRIGEAGAVLQAGLILEPGEVALARLQARLLVDRDDLAGAVQVLERALRRSPGDPEGHAFLAGIQARRGAHGQAVEHYRSALQQQSGRGMWWLGLAIALEGQDDRAGALAAYRNARASGRVGGESLHYVQRRIAALQTLGGPIQARNR